MTSPADSSSKLPITLTEHLQDVTEALVAARTQAEVLYVVLRPALQALAALAGGVLLVDETGRSLRMAAQRGYVTSRPILWQDGPLEDQGPATDVLRTQEALYFEHAGELVAVYPELEEKTGAVAAVATAVLPMFLDGRPLGTLVLDFNEPHTFMPEERRFLRALAAQCAVALGRAEGFRLLEQQLEVRTRTNLEDTQAHEAFVAFTEAIGSETDLAPLVRQAITLLQNRFSGATIIYCEQEDSLWKGRIWSDDLRPEQVAVVAAGVPMDTPLIAEILQTRQPVFTDEWPVRNDDATRSREYGAAGGYPLIVNGDLHWLLSVGLRETRRWSEADKALVRAVGRALTLALERTETARQLIRQNAELHARTRALEAFADLTRDLALSTDPLLLIQRAQEVVMSMLSEGAAMYFVPEEDHWVSRVQHGGLQSPELQTAIDGRLPYAEVKNLLIAWTSGKPHFQEQLTEQNSLRPSAVAHIGATASLPLRVEGNLTGILALVLFQQRVWSSVDRVVLETAVQSLELALDRAAKTRRLDEERTALEAFTRFTESVGSETDVHTLVQQAITLLGDVSTADAVYLERDGELFRPTVWSPHFEPALLARLQAGFPLRQSSLALVLRASTAAFIDHWSNHEDAAGITIEESLHLQAVAGYPLFRNGEMQSVLLIGSRTFATWSERDKGILRAVGHSLDLALDRARHAEELAARTQELEASTQELEAFSYSVSHDLRTPVRHMLGFLLLAQKELDGKIDERSARYLNMVEQAGGQMNTLIDALLHLSNTAQQTLRPAMVDLNGIMTQIKATLTPDLTTRNIEWTVTDLPQVWGDPDALKQVLTQLTENAVKFTKTRDPATVRIWAEDQGETWAMFVQDNGLGFDPRYQDRLFTMFQRLHSAQEVSGTGVGLAHVKRLVLKHGGQVLARGQVGQGATFGFTLPKGGPALLPA